MKQRLTMTVENVGQLLTCAQDAVDLVGCQKKWCLGVDGERIVYVGPHRELVENYDLESAERIDAQNGVVLPGFVDSHTHLVFAGTRVEEYVGRLRTDDLVELARLGVPLGIMVTLDAVRSATEESLFEQSAQRLTEMIIQGTTTVESKSGYGLSIESEMKELRVNRRLGMEMPIELVSTFLGGHGWPPDRQKAEYLQELVEEMIPSVGKSGLAEFCDAWCDEGHYSAEECRIILKAGQRWGMKPKLHTGAYSYVGGADVAAELGAVSADHLNYTPGEALRSLHRAGVTAVLLPGIDFAVRHSKPFDPKPIYKAGLNVALGTNCCPGCWCTSMPMILQLACRNHGLSPEQAIRAATWGGACALRRDRSIGSLVIGKRADFQIWKIPRYEDAIYHLGSPFVEFVVSRGRPVARQGHLLSVRPN